MLEGKAVIEDTDMPLKMQIQAMASASEALDLYDVLDCTSIAAHIKKVTFSAIFPMIHNNLMLHVLFLETDFSVTFL